MLNKTYLSASLFLSLHGSGNIVQKGGAEEMKALESRKKCYEMLSPRHNVLIAEPNQSSHNCSLEVRDGSPEALYPAKGLYWQLIATVKKE